MAKPEEVSKSEEKFPLYEHRGSGQWAKRIDTKLIYFGVLAAPELAKERLDNFMAGRGKFTNAELAEQIKPGEIILEDLVNAFLTAKLRMVQNKELSRVTLSNYTVTCERLLKHLGANVAVAQITPAQFENLRNELAKTRGHVALKNELQRVRSVFKWGHDTDRIGKPVKTKELLKPPTKSAMRIERNAKTKALFEATEVRSILAAVGPQMRAMILLGLNCGFGNTDCATLPEAAINFKTGWLDYSRPKTGAKRRAPLWPETIVALRAALSHRPATILPDAKGCVFVTQRGFRWVHLAERRGTFIDSLGLQFGKLLRRLKMKRDRLNFYTFRHMFETIAGESLDQPAIDLVMGHSADGNDMAANYRQGISDDRLRKVVESVRQWLWPAGSEAKQVIIDAQADETPAETTTKPKATRKRTTKK